MHYNYCCIIKLSAPAWGGKCSDGGIVPNTAFIFRVFVATPRTPSYICIFCSFYLALNLHTQVVNSLSYSITRIFLSKFLNNELKDELELMKFFFMLCRSCMNLKIHRNGPLYLDLLTSDMFCTQRTCQVALAENQ